MRPLVKRKAALVDEVIKLLKDAKIIAVVSLNNVPASQTFKINPWYGK